MIDLTTPMLGPVDTDTASIVPLFKGNAYNDATVDAFAAALVKWTGVFGLRSSIIAGQIAKETGFFHFGGQVQPAQYNLAGLGSTNDGAAGLRYPDIDTGVCAVCAHHMTYIHGGVQNWPLDVQRYLALDKRHDAVMSTGNGGAVEVLGDYTNGRWAFTPGISVGSLDNGYATGIAAIANQMAAGGTSVSNEPTQADIGFPVEVDYTTAFPGAPTRALSDIRFFVMHDTEGGEQGSESVLLGGGASVHALIDTDGALEYMVPIDTTAWTAGNDAVSRLAVQVELVGFASGQYPEEQYQSVAAFFKWCVAQGMANVPLIYRGKSSADGILPDENGVIGHQDVPNPNRPGSWGGVSGHTDPGPNFQWDKFLALAGGPITPPQPRYRKFTETGHGIGGGFLDHFEKNGDVDNFGFPVSEEFQFEGRTTQAFQRFVVQWFPEFKGTKYEYQSMLLGSAWAAAHGFKGPGIPA